MAAVTETKRAAHVGFNVKWHREWPVLEQFVRSPKHREKITIFPRMELPAEHPIVLTHREYFR